MYNVQSWCLSPSLSLSELVIGFAEVDYTVGEGDGTVSLTVAVLSGQMQDEAIVTFYTADLTAIGIHCVFCVYVYTTDSYRYSLCVLCIRIYH